MRELQATWVPEGRLFFWARAGSVDEAVAADLPSLTGVPGTRTSRALADADAPTRRRTVDGIEVPTGEAAAVLARVPLGTGRVSDSVRCFALAARLGLELAAGQRVVPGTAPGKARWRALLARPEDRDRFARIAAALPTAGRALATQPRGPVRVLDRAPVVRGFLDDTVDHAYRQGAWPGPSRGWPLALAQALRGDEAEFSPRDARYQSIPAVLADWVRAAEGSTLHLGLTLGLPDADGNRFPLDLWVQPVDQPGVRVPIADAWAAGARLEIDGATWTHPAFTALRGLARARTLFAPVGRALRGRRPTSITLDGVEAWTLLAEARPALQAAAIAVEVPAEFASASSRRLRPRLCVAAPPGEGPLDLGQGLAYRWEVAIGDHVLDGTELAALVGQRSPIVRYDGEWVLLDPAEVARLPSGLAREGVLPGPAALRAVLTGEHEGMPVVADARLRTLLEALRHPPDEDLPADLRATLRPYQRRGYAWLTALGRLGLGACLGDDMGLGKTVQLVAHLLRRREHDRGGAPALVVCPTSVLGNWAREIERFAPALTVALHHGPDRDLSAARRSAVVLTSYGLLVRDADDLAAAAWDVIALDEAQSIKNPDSRRARAARRLRAAHRVALTGTPMENRLDEVWSLFDFLVPGLLGPRATFHREVALPVERFGDDDAAAHLRGAVAPFLLRRLKTDPTVISDLPDKVERRAWCGLTREQEALYEDVVERSMSEIAGSTDIERRGRVLAMLTALKQVCNHPAQLADDADRGLAGRSGKLDAATELLERILDRRERALVFTQYRVMGDLLQRHLREVFGFDAPFLHGGTPPAAREEMVRAFQDDPDAPPVLLISLRAGGTGLNLTAATHVVHYDRWWNPAVEDQATDRAFRIGQDCNVLVHKFVCTGTLEERIDALLERKRALAEQVVGAGETWLTELDDAALRALVALVRTEGE